MAPNRMASLVPKNMASVLQGQDVYISSLPLPSCISAYGTEYHPIRTAERLEKHPNTD